MNTNELYNTVIANVLSRDWDLSTQNEALEAELSAAYQEIERLLAERDELRSALADALVIYDTLPGVFNRARIERARGLVREATK